MNLFYRRPLCIILCIMLGGFSVFPFLSPIFKAIFASSALILVFISTLLTLKSKKITFFSVCSLLLLFSVLISFFYFDFYANPAERFPEKVAIEGKIYEVKIIDEEEKIIGYTIKTSKIDDKHSSYKLTFTTSGEDNADITVGSIVSLMGRIARDRTDREISDYHFSVGIFGEISSVGELSFVRQGAKPISYYTSSIRGALTDYSVDVSNNSTGTLLSALLFGERQALSPSVKTSFTNIGISHILALSGMHVTLLCLAISRLLLLLRVKRRERLIVTIVVSVVYMILTGMSVSVVRAGVMMIISTVMALLFKSSDQITSLFLSVFVIILLAPYSVYSVSLWLSAFATLGVLLSLDFIDLVPYKKSIPRRALRFVVTSAVSSVFALVATMLLSSLIFGKFSPLSLISTLVFSVLIEIVMYVGAFMLMLGKIIPISFILNPIVDFTLWLAKAFADMKMAVISTNLYVDLLLIITSAVFAILITVKVKSKGALLSTVISLLLVSTLPILIYGSVSAKETSVYYTAEISEDLIFVKDGERAHVISYGNTYKNNAYEIYDILLDKNVHSIDTYIIFEISDNSLKEVSTLLSRIPVKTVLMPKIEYTGDTEPSLQDELEWYLGENGASVEYFSDGAEYTVGNFSFLPLIYKKSNEDTRHVAFFATLLGNKSLYLSSGILSSEYASYINGAIPGADTLVLGKYGTGYQGKFYFDGYFDNLSEIIFSGDKIYLTPEMATRYEENGCKLTSHPSLYRLFN